MSRWTYIVLTIAFISIISQPLIRSHEGHVHGDEEDDEHETLAEETSSMAPPTESEKEEEPSLPPNLPKEKVYLFYFYHFSCC